MRYVGIASASGSYFQASKNSAVAEFAAVADCHPVFKLIPADEDRQRRRVGVHGLDIACRGARSHRFPDRRCGPG